MNLSKVEKATLATSLAIFEEHITNPENEVSNQDPLSTLATLVIIRGLLKKLELVEIWKDIHEKADSMLHEEK